MRSSLFKFITCRFLQLSFLSLMTIEFSGNAYSQSLTPKLDANKGKWGYVDASGKWIVKPAYDDAAAFKGMPDGSKAAFVKKNGTIGYIDQSGKPKGAGIVFTSIDSISPKAAIIKVKDKYGFAGWDLNYIQKPDFSYVSPVGNNIYIIERGGKYGLANSNGDLLVKPSYTSIDYNHKDFFKIFKDYKCGLFDVKTQTLVFEPEYKDVSKMVSISGIPMIPVCNDKGNWGIINRTGAVVLDFDYSGIDPIEPLSAFILTKIGKTYLYYPADDGMVEVSNLKQSAEGPFQTLSATIITPASYDTKAKKLYSSRFKNNPAINLIFTDEGKIISKDPKSKIRQLPSTAFYLLSNNLVSQIYDKDVKLIGSNFTGEPTVDHGWILFQESAISPDKKIYKLSRRHNKLFVEVADNEGRNNWQELVNGSVQASKFSGLGESKGDLVNVEKDGKWGVMGKDDMIIPFLFEVEPTYMPEYGIIAGQINERIGIYNLKGEIVIPHEYEECYYQGNDIIQAKTGDDVTLYNMEGQVLVGPDKLTEIEVDEDYIIAKRNGKFIYYTKSGTPLIADKFSNISQIDDCDGYYWVGNNDLWGVMDSNFKIIVPIKYYDQDLHYNSGLFEAYTGPKTTYYNLDGSINPAKPKVIVTSQYLEHNAYHNGNKCVDIHYDFNTEFLNADGNQIYVKAQIYKKNGQPAKDNKGGDIFYGYWASPSYIFSTFSDRTIYFPLSNFKQGKGKVEYYIKLTFSDESGRMIPTTGNNKLDFYLTR